ncbi:MAG: hypothetical protein WD533_03970 [Dehalococcoidia bacterium]
MRRHIREAEELSTLLGGTDQTVKQFLFSLPPDQLNQLMDEYGRLYGEAARQYALETIPKWRSGRVTMSGMVAERLYRLLPPMMPYETKYEIAAELWKHTGPVSRRTLRFGPDALQGEVVDNIVTHLTKVVPNHSIPSALALRFKWLTQGDVVAEQHLLNQLRQMDVKLVSEAALLQVPNMINHAFGPAAEQISRFEHELTVGNHKLKLIADQKQTGCQFEAYDSATASSSTNDWSWLIWSALIIGFIVLVNLAS